MSELDDQSILSSTIDRSENSDNKKKSSKEVETLKKKLKILKNELKSLLGQKAE